MSEDEFTEYDIELAINSGNFELASKMLTDLYEDEEVVYAASSGEFEMVKYLIENGASFSCCAIITAASEEICDYLIKKQIECPDQYRE